MSARTQVAALLTAHLTGVDLLPYARDVEGPAKLTVMMRLDSVDRGPTLGTRAYHYTLILMVPQLTPGPADDQLEDLLAEVMLALEKADIPAGLTWDKATRATFEGRAPAFELPIVVYLAISSE